MLRSMLFVCLLLMTAGCSPPTAQDKVIAFVESKGGTVDRDTRFPGKPVFHVHLRETKVTDADLKELAPLTELTMLNLSKNPITDVGLKELAPFTKLTDLALRETEVTDAGIPDIIKFKHLTALYLGGSKITAAGRKEILKALPKCEISE
ncbi:MAG: hypothetical protein K8U57_02400 [Planctomycetes bacterium]|nr:hypothetical protein [Planctomycetota bacterium]